MTRSGSFSQLLFCIIRWHDFWGGGGGPLKGRYFLLISGKCYSLKNNWQFPVCEMVSHALIYWTRVYFMFPRWWHYRNHLWHKSHCNSLSFIFEIDSIVYSRELGSNLYYSIIVGLFLSKNVYEYLVIGWGCCRSVGRMFVQHAWGSWFNPLYSISQAWWCTSVFQHLEGGGGCLVEDFWKKSQIVMLILFVIF